MQPQLDLGDPRGVDWHLDERTREVGRRGVARAREALRDATRREATRPAAPARTGAAAA